MQKASGKKGRGASRRGIVTAATAAVTFTFSNNSNVIEEKDDKNKEMNGKDDFGHDPKCIPLKEEEEDNSKSAPRCSSFSYDGTLIGSEAAHHNSCCYNKDNDLRHHHHCKEENGLNVPNKCPSLCYDAIVVGSGYGGAVAACRLAQAGLRVCILEKGRAWPSPRFPTCIPGLFLSTSLHTPTFSIGSPSALYQLHAQGDSLAAVACGLGGGSLVNAGVMVGATRRARLDKRWPAQWEKSWQHNENRARAMLGAQPLALEHPPARVMEAISSEIEDCVRDPLHLSINMQAPSTMAAHASACKACGNCLTGCPYDAKNSTDKTYIAAALQAGADVLTECEVSFILENNVETYGCFPTEGYNDDDQTTVKGRRWRVYINEIDHLLADFVVLSAGVLGTTGILLRSKQRGLQLSDRLGFGFSTNGNNVALVSGSQAPTKAYGLAPCQFLGTPLPSRPGPSISSSFTSSQGFTIQGAVLPRAYPKLLFMGVCSYQWQGNGYSLMRGVWEVIKHWMKTEDSEAIVLNVMGTDSADGQILLDQGNDCIRFFPPEDLLLAKKIVTFQKLTERLGGILFMSRYRSTSVHLLGGCTAAQDAIHGVVNPWGQVYSPACIGMDIGSTNSGKGLHQRETSILAGDIKRESSPSHVHEGLYVCDASVIPCAVGTNPSLTIATLAEHIAGGLVLDALQYSSSHLYSVGSSGGCKDLSFIPGGPDAEELLYVKEALPERLLNGMQMPVVAGKSVLSPSLSPSLTSSVSSSLSSSTSLLTDLLYSSSYRDISVRYQRFPVGAIVKEKLCGSINGLPCTLDLVMHMDRPESSKAKFFGGPHQILRGRVGGRMVMRSVDQHALHVVDGRVDLCWLNPRTPYTQYMQYHLVLASASGSRYVLKGNKEMRPSFLFFFSWKECTTLQVTLQQVAAHKNQVLHAKKAMHGTMHISILGVVKSLWTIRGPAKHLFVRKLMESLMRTYLISKPRPTASTSELSPCKDGINRGISDEGYPPHVVHNIRTDDDFKISCIQWVPMAWWVHEEINDCVQHNKSQVAGNGGATVKGVVVLLNGYSTENFWIPVRKQPTDLVRVLLKQQYEVWLVQSRLHPDNALINGSHSFNLDDIARFDLPAVFAKIKELHGYEQAVHVIAHCVGGLTIHMAILGGYILASSIASLTCTNSSMFFQLSTFARLKMWLPLIPVCMAVLGEGRRVVRLTGTCEDGFRHVLLKRMARAMPRVEPCPCEECHVFSGIFGNTYWHEHVGARVHEWVHHHSLSCLPLQAFPHLRTICLAGRLLAADGTDRYLPFVDRMAVPTLYISGQRPLLVMPETTARAHYLLKCHHPHLPHRREVIPSYGHSDLFIGDNSHHDVFPLILHHISSSSNLELAPHNKQTLTWDVSPRHSFPSIALFFSPLIIIVLILLLIFSF